MALSDLSIFEEETEGRMMELLDYNTDLFNQASGGGMTLSTAAHKGNFSTENFWKRLEDLVRRRNPYQDSTVPERSLSMGEWTTVKVGAGTNTVRLDQAWMAWIQRDPVEAAMVMGQNLAEQTINDMVTAGTNAFKAAITPYPDELWNAFDDTAGPADLLDTAGLWGDRSSQLRSWIMHSAVAYSMWGNNLENTERLFMYGDVRIMADPEGRPFIMTDNPVLVIPGDPLATPAVPTRYDTLGLAAGGINVELNSDYRSNMESKNGRTNITDTFQAEWSFQLGLRGMSWDKTAGGVAPTDPALATSDNWNKVMESFRDMPGVIMRSNGRARRTQLPIT